jgi:hypothetical protein
VNRKTVTVLLLVLGIGVATANAIEQVTVAAFSNMRPGGDLPDEWQAITVGRIARHTDYTLVSQDGRTVLRARADASMSSVGRETDVDPNAMPWLSWQWRIAALNNQSDLRSKGGDDFPVRIYVFFDYDLMQLPLAQRVFIRIARTLYGERLPLAALCYVWANQEPTGTTAWNAYTERVRMIVAASGSDRTGQWLQIERNVLQDYRAAFGDPVPRITAIALATDTDDTAQRSIAWYGDIVFSTHSRLAP